jgi:hypothetical protein
MVAMTNNHNLFPLPCWAPALRRVPMPLQLLNEAYQRGAKFSDSEPRPNPAAEPIQNFSLASLSPLPSGRGR